MARDDQCSLLRYDSVIDGAILDLMPDAIVICDASGSIRQVNRHFTAMFGYEPEEILSKPVEILLPVDLRDRHGAHRADYQREPKTRAMNGGRNFVCRDKAGRELPIDIMLTPVPNGPEPLIMAVIRDMTKQKRMGIELAEQCAKLEKNQAALSQQNALFDAALNNMTHGLAMFDVAGGLLVCNSKFREIYRITDPEQVIGVTWDDLLGLLVHSGLISEDDRIRQRREGQLALHKSREASVNLTLTDSRTIAVSHRKMENGGCVSVHCDITDRLHAETEIHRLATHDFLTGLPNRLFLEQRIAGLRRTRGFANMLALHYLDLDRFKQVNDNFGHRCGDHLLQAVASRLSQIVPPEDIIARLGGDEFVVVQLGIEDEATAVHLGTRIINTISEPYRISGRRVQIGVSIGLAFSRGRPDLADLLRQSDLALYEAKQDGKGLVRVFASMQLTHRHRSYQIEQRLLGAIGRNEICVHFQPIVDCRSRRVHGFEALLRWTDPILGLVAPSEFIPIAEQNGAIVAIGLWVLEKACKIASKWPSHLRVAVNVSPLQFGQPDFVTRIKETLTRCGLPGHRLELEVTESRLFLRDEIVMRKLTALRDLGIRISADDFGTGYSSLHQLKNFPFDVIKIDRSFVSGDTTKSAEIVRAIVGLAKGLGMETIAEGVETYEQHQLVLSAGCEEIQGNLISAAMPADRIPAFLRRCEALEGAA